MSLKGILTVEYGSPLLTYQITSLNDVRRKLEYGRFGGIEDTEGMDNNRRFVGQEKAQYLVAYLTRNCEQRFSGNTSLGDPRVRYMLLR